MNVKADLLAKETNDHEFDYEYITNLLLNKDLGPIQLPSSNPPLKITSVFQHVYYILN